MRDQFSHLLQPTEAEVEHAFSDGTLTVDANVLLDLYRYHAETRDALLATLRSFQGRCWISYQSASEFMRNRERVAAVVEKDLKDAEADLQTLENATRKTADDLRGRRAISREVSQGLRNEVESAIRTARATIAETRTRQAEQPRDDAILDLVFSLFEGRVGPAPTPNELVELQKEAERRIKERIPPGYEDAKKDGARAHGDFLVWHQVLQHAKSSGKPVILVTSEKKEDWWESAHGKTLGPRHELLTEARSVAGQRVFIYQTETFIKLASARTGETVSDRILNEIRAPRDDHELANIIGAELEEIANDMLMNEETLADRMAETNADDWGIDWVDVSEVAAFDYATCTASFGATLHYSGKQLEDRMWCGTEMTAQIRGTVGFHDGSWRVIEHEILGASIDHPEDPADEA